MKTDEFTEEKRDILASITDIFREKMVSVISTSINEDIVLEKVAESVINKQIILSSMSNSFIAARFYFKEGFKGEITFLIGKSTVAQIADKMLMGEGDAEFDAAEHLDAIQEVFNQVLGASSTEFSGVFEFSVVFSEADAKVTEFREFETGTGDGDLMTQFTITILDKSDVYIITSAQTFDNILSRLASTQGDNAQPAIHGDVLEQVPIGSNMIGEVSAGKDLGLLMDVRLPVSVELGRKRMFIRDILKLTPGEVVELPKLQGEPVDLYVNDKKFATGEVVVIAENFGIRIKSLIRPEERLRDSDAWADERSK